jgi:hypothetical protein
LACDFLFLSLPHVKAISFHFCIPFFGRWIVSFVARCLADR